MIIYEIQNNLDRFIELLSGNQYVFDCHGPKEDIERNQIILAKASELSKLLEDLPDSYTSQFWSDLDYEAVNCSPYK